jgi:hypothetical protein
VPNAGRLRPGSPTLCSRAEMGTGTQTERCPDWLNLDKECAMARRYSKGASKSVKSAMRRRKRGSLKSGRSGKTVKSRKQAIAIGLSEARKKGAKVPKRKTAKRK